MGMGMGVNLCPWVLKWVGIESFYGYGFGQKDVVPAHTLPIAIPIDFHLIHIVRGVRNTSVSKE